MYAVVVPIKVKPEMRDKFLAAAEDDSTCSVRDEPQDNTDPNRFFFYEVYKDEAAYKAHQQTPHYPRWREAAAVCLAEPTQASRCTTIFPKNYK
jgi:(4S)-4-hydroxy-5-phosphonooxypentane-2,3-dione isomerase